MVLMEIHLMREILVILVHWVLVDKVVLHIQREEQMLVQVVMVVTLMTHQRQVQKELRIDQVLDMIHLVMLVVQVLMVKLYTTVAHPYRLVAPFLVIQ